MATALPIRALIFDLDGTLIDTEVQTEVAIREVVARHGVPGFALPAAETRGRTWPHVARTINEHTGLDLPIDPLVDELQRHWSAATSTARAVPGGAELMQTAHRRGLALSVVSSSPRAVIDQFLARLGIGQCVPASHRIGGDEVRRGKPDPEGFLRAASRLSTSPADCLVFEDSQAGLLAARAAGMRSMYIYCCAGENPALAALATASVHDYTRITPLFWEEIVTGRTALAGEHAR